MINLRLISWRARAGMEAALRYRLVPVRQARQRPMGNRLILMGLKAFRSFGSPRALRKRLGETWEGSFPGQARVKGHHTRAAWGPNVYFPRACRGKVLFFAPRYPAGFIRAYPFLEARQSLRENSPILIGLVKFVRK